MIGALAAWNNLRVKNARQPPPSILIVDHFLNFLLAPVAEKSSAVPSGLASHTEHVDPLQVDVGDHDGWVELSAWWNMTGMLADKH